MDVFQFKHVGKGLFYAGSINDEINFVYDCGTEDSEKSLQNELTALDFPCASKIINFVIVSDLATEHINGLPELCASYKVKKIYLPYLGEDKNLIRLILFTSIFLKNAVKGRSLTLYSFMCKLYGVDILDSYNVKLHTPEEIEFFGKSDDNNYINDENMSNIRRYAVFEDNTLWRFIVLNRTINQENYSIVRKNFLKTFRQFSDDFYFNASMFENYLFEQVKTLDGTQKLQNELKSIFGEWNATSLSENILIHYPQRPLCSMQLCEYKSSSYNNYISAPFTKFEGSISVLVGDAEMSFALVDQIFRTGNYSLCASILQLPERCINEMNPLFKKLIGPFRKFIFPANAGAASKIKNTTTAKSLKAIYQNIYISTQDTGITYYVI